MSVALSENRLECKGGLETRLQAHYEIEQFGGMTKITLPMKAPLRQIQMRLLPKQQI